MDVFLHMLHPRDTGFCFTGATRPGRIEGQGYRHHGIEAKGAGSRTVSVEATHRAGRSESALGWQSGSVQVLGKRIWNLFSN